MSGRCFEHYHQRFAALGVRAIAPCLMGGMLLQLSLLARAPGRIRKAGQFGTMRCISSRRWPTCSQTKTAQQSARRAGRQCYISASCHHPIQGQ